jgi:lipoprotein NlpD
VNQFIRSIAVLLLSAGLGQGACAQFNVSGPGFVPDENGRNLDEPYPKGAAQEAPNASEVPNASESPPVFVWPTIGKILMGFDESKNRKGMDIGGELGTPILAAANGKVVYAGEGLRGYGKLIIIRHKNTFLTAYAHNQTLLVKEDQLVNTGQQIAEMGSSETDRAKLHFEIRRLGKPVDPLLYLPMLLYGNR